MIFILHEFALWFNKKANVILVKSSENWTKNEQFLINKSYKIKNIYIQI